MKNRFVTVALAAMMFAPGIHAEDKKTAATSAGTAFPETFLKTSPSSSDLRIRRISGCSSPMGSGPRNRKRSSSASQPRRGRGRRTRLCTSRACSPSFSRITRWDGPTARPLPPALGSPPKRLRHRPRRKPVRPQPLAGTALPGTVKARPTTLADWAAAVALVADDTTAREGRAVVLAVRDDLSGVSVATAEAIERENRGPWATAMPVQLEDVLPNLFAMPQATPMDRKSMKGGMFALGALALAGSAYSSTRGRR